MKTLFNVILFFSLSAMIGCESSREADTTKESDASAEVEKIKEHYLTWMHGAERGDIDAYFNAISDDFVYFQAGGKPIDDRDSLRSMLETFFANNFFSVPDLTSHDIEVWDDIAIHRYTATNIITSKADSSVVELERKYIDVYRKNENGEWKAFLHLHFILD